jgi:P27 family predicted phage terminase small subunit
LQRSGELTIKTAKGHPRVNPLVRIASQALADMQRIGAQFGLSPNSRLRLGGISPPPPPSKFDGLLGSCTGEPSGTNPNDHNG